MENQSPIGIFDSGIGGLTVANVVSNLLPKEQIIYFGDTAHLPYGDKSANAIRDYGREIMSFLVKQNCKIIVIACNSASASIGKYYKKWVNSEIPVVNVIDPVIEHLSLESYSRIGLIGTKRTVQSGIFSRSLKKSAPKKTMKSIATPLLAPMIEEGFFNNNISKTIIKSYLDNPRLRGIDSLVLACTHYPLIEKEIRTLVGKKIQIVNSAEVVAHKIKNVLEENNLLNTSTKSEDHKFFISDYTNSFERAANRFFGKKIKLKEHNLWKK